MNGEKPAAGMLQIDESMGDTPPNWVVYFTVNDFDSSAEKAKKSGATQLFDKIVMPGVGTFSMFMDPQGVAFSMIQFE